jgi:thiol:disulfide interchange protein DsbD
MKVTVGDKNTDLQITKFNSNSQPYYFIVDANGNKLIEPVGYTSVENFTKFLEDGKKKFEELK